MKMRPLFSAFHVMSQSALQLIIWRHWLQMIYGTKAVTQLRMLPSAERRKVLEF